MVVEPAGETSFWRRFKLPSDLIELDKTSVIYFSIQRLCLAPNVANKNGHFPCTTLCQMSRTRPLRHGGCDDAGDAVDREATGAAQHADVPGAEPQRRRLHAASSGEEK